MSEVLWGRLCTVEVPEQFAPIAARARARLAASWAALRPEERIMVGERLGGAPAEDPQDLLRYLSTNFRELYDAAIGVRGVVVLAVEVGAAPPPRAPREKVWAGPPVVYQECEHSWYAAVSLDLAAGRRP